MSPLRLARAIRSKNYCHPFVRLVGAIIGVDAMVNVIDIMVISLLFLHLFITLERTGKTKNAEMVFELHYIGTFSPNLS